MKEDSPGDPLGLHVMRLVHRLYFSQVFYSIILPSSLANMHVSTAETCSGAESRCLVLTGGSSVWSYYSIL
jgi:hypothetical protein